MVAGTCWIAHTVSNLSPHTLLSSPVSRRMWERIGFVLRPLLAVRRVRRLARSASYGVQRPMKLIYFIKDTRGGEIRIGIARKRRLEKRLQELQLGNPGELKLLGVIRARNARALMRELHTTFSDGHVRGGWFKPTPQLETYIRSRAVMP